MSSPPGIRPSGGGAGAHGEACDGSSYERKVVVKELFREKAGSGGICGKELSAGDQYSPHAEGSGSEK